MHTPDARQHQAIEAGRPYQQLQEAGMETARLDRIVRQRDPALLAVVEQLSRGHVAEAIDQLDHQGRLHEIADPEQRVAAIALAYLNRPDNTLVVSPDHQSRIAINEGIHRARQSAGQVERVDHPVPVLVARQDLTGPDRQWAAQYHVGDVVRYTRGSRTHGLNPGEYARVVQVNTDENLVTVSQRHGAPITYDPRRLQGVTLYRETVREFAVGDRVQVTAPDRPRHVANRELGTILAFEKGELQVRLDSGRTVAFAIDRHAHLDYGYAVTSHSSQGLTADRVLIHVELATAGEQTVNRRLAYVAVSRGRYDAQIYTDDKAQLAQALSRDLSHRSAVEMTRALEPSAQAIRRPALEHAPAHSF